MRRGELLGLKWGDVDLENATVRVRRTLTRNGTGHVLGEPKTKKSRRTVRITPQAVEALNCHRAKQSEEMLNLDLSTRSKASYSPEQAAVSSTPPTSDSDPSSRS